MFPHQLLLASCLCVVSCCDFTELLVSIFYTPMLQSEALTYVGTIPNPLTDKISHYEWYYGLDAGGFPSPFKKHPGVAIHTLELGFLTYCREKCTNAVRFHAAFDKFHAGLWDHVNSDSPHLPYLDFLVPFGNVYRGRRLGDCHDKPYFLFCQSKLGLTNKHLLFFRALERRFANPRREGVWRDIGQRLDATKYNDDLNLKEGRHEDQPTAEDLAFIDDSGVSSSETEAEDSEEESELKGDSDSEDDSDAEESSDVSDSDDSNSTISRDSELLAGESGEALAVNEEKLDIPEQLVNPPRLSPATASNKRKRSEHRTVAGSSAESDSSIDSSTARRPQTRLLTQAAAAALAGAETPDRKLGRVKKKRHTSNDETGVVAEPPIVTNSEPLSSQRPGGHQQVPILMKEARTWTTGKLLWIAPSPPASVEDSIDGRRRIRVKEVVEQILRETSRRTIQLIPI
ncbi:hypothetical protein B0H16DRAFT_1457677 [Mycena metata]|uniref:Uncharacterized protein n=1 Tax=Mycena metata TaxID=1033252 RepID=A0AAD7J9H9_9AGAR|nr:hypothetical protein B0H16DRAFT_1457677 [Mycena metata]